MPTIGAVMTTSSSVAAVGVEAGAATGAGAGATAVAVAAGAGAASGAGAVIATGAAVVGAMAVRSLRDTKSSMSPYLIDSSRTSWWCAPNQRGP